MLLKERVDTVNKRLDMASLHEEEDEQLEIPGVRHDSESRRRPQESLESIKESWNYGNLKRNQLCN